MKHDLSSILGYILKHPVGTFKECTEMIRCCTTVSPFWGPQYPRVLSRGIRLLLRGFHGEEALSLGLLNVGLSESELEKVVSKSEMIKTQEMINPQAWTMLLENKAVFYKYCKSLSLPVPELYALWFRNYAGYAKDGLILRNRADWEDFLRVCLPEDFVVKPAVGAYGNDVMVFRRNGEDGFIDIASDKPCKAEDILKIMMSCSQLVIQERLKSHPEIVRLSGSRSLQTLRIFTYLDGRGECRIICAFLKPVVGKNVVDNHRHGETGNLLAEIDLTTGTLKAALKMIPNVSGLSVIDRHPETGHRFEGFAVPLWNEVCRIAKQAALNFMPVRIVGWDIGVTPDGPRIVEGNWDADPPSWHKNMDIMLAQVRDDLLRGNKEGWFCRDT